jgi:hypothetical protein
LIFKQRHTCLAVLAFLAHARVDATEETAPPNAAEQDKLLMAMQHYAAQYVSGLPNFVCLQITRQYRAPRSSEHWHKGDTLTSKLTFNQGHEERTLQQVNGKEIHSAVKRWHTPLVTEGEFGLLLSHVLGPDSRASFTWSHWETVNGKRLAVFDFDVDKQHSTLSLSLSDFAKATVPYQGSVYADPSTGSIWRISDTAFHIPPELQTERIATTIDYSEVLIGSATYLLPVKAAVALLLDRTKIRNEMEFVDYRKFEAESEIKFGPPVPADGYAPKPKQ